MWLRHGLALWDEGGTLIIYIYIYIDVCSYVGGGEGSCEEVAANEYACALMSIAAAKRACACSIVVKLWLILLQCIVTAAGLCLATGSSDRGCQPWIFFISSHSFIYLFIFFCYLFCSLFLPRCHSSFTGWLYYVELLSFLFLYLWHSRHYFLHNDYVIFNDAYIDIMCILKFWNLTVVQVHIIIMWNIFYTIFSLCLSLGNLPTTHLMME